MNKIQYSIARGAEIENYIDDVARLRIEIFRDFPYLYEGNIDYEKKYLRPYIRSQRSACILVKDNGNVVGISTCIPLTDEAYVFQKPYVMIREDVNSIFYFGESLLYKDYRGRGIGVEFFKLREQEAKRYPVIKKTAFCAVERPLDHPLRPKDYVPLDAFWTKRGYKKREELYTLLDWQDVDKDESDFKKLVFWEKQL